MTFPAAVQETLWPKQQLNDFNTIMNIIKLYDDNLSAICMTKNRQCYSRSDQISFYKRKY